MKKRLITPLGEILIYLDGILSDYEALPHCCSVRSVLKKPVGGCYIISVPVNHCQSVRCVVALDYPDLPNEGCSGERYWSSAFVKNNIILTIGAEDDNPHFETNQLRYGMEYILHSPMDAVTFAIAWATDYEGPFDIRTDLATDIF